MIATPNPSPRTSARRALATAAVAVFATFGSLSGGLAAAASAPDTVAPATTPDTTPDTTPATTPITTPVTTPDSVPDSGDGEGTDWWPIALVAALGIALIALVVALVSRRPKPAAVAPNPTASPQSELLSTAQWVHDQLTLELLAAPPQQAQQRWTIERSRLDNIAIGAQQEWTAGHGESWQRLGQTMSGLAAAVDTSLQLRGQEPPNAQLINESNAVVNQRRAEIQALLTAMWPTVRR